MLQMIGTDDILEHRKQYTSFFPSICFSLKSSFSIFKFSRIINYFGFEVCNSSIDFVRLVVVNIFLKAMMMI